MTRALARISAGAISGSLGFGIMYKLSVATNPVGLTALLCVWAGLLGRPWQTSPLQCALRFCGLSECAV